MRISKLSIAKNIKEKTPNLIHESYEIKFDNSTIKNIACF